MVVVDGGPAFPHEDYQTGDARGQRGMSLRDWFAGQALTVAFREIRDRHGGFNELAAKWAAEDAYLAADAMLAARSKEA